VVVDGKTAWFENTSEKTVYKVNLPANAAISPLMFMPLIPSASQVERKPDAVVDGKTVIVLSAMTPQGGVGRMEIEAAGYHIRRVSTETLVGLSKVTSAITMDKEVFDGEVPESVFTYKQPRGLKELPAPPDAGVIFGSADKK
jgi:outer membrane lipoprotein-sorting protein